VPSKASVGSPCCPAVGDQAIPAGSCKRPGGGEPRPVELRGRPGAGVGPGDEPGAPVARHRGVGLLACGGGDGDPAGSSTAPAAETRARRGRTRCPRRRSDQTTRKSLPSTHRGVALAVHRLDTAIAAGSEAPVRSASEAKMSS